MIAAGVIAAGWEYREMTKWRNAMLNPNCTFYDLLKISAESPAMIVYLDTVNSKGSGNNVRGPYENPFPLDENLFLVSRRGTVMVRDYAGTQRANIIAPRDGLGFYSPQPFRPRVRPPVAGW